MAPGLLCEAALSIGTEHCRSAPDKMGCMSGDATKRFWSEYEQISINRELVICSKETLYVAQQNWAVGIATYHKIY